MRLISHPSCPHFTVNSYLHTKGRPRVSTTLSASFYMNVGLGTYTYDTKMLSTLQVILTLQCCIFSVCQWVDESTYVNVSLPERSHFILCQSLCHFKRSLSCYKFLTMIHGNEWIPGCILCHPPVLGLGDLAVMR